MISSTILRIFSVVSFSNHGFIFKFTFKTKLRIKANSRKEMDDNWDRLGKRERNDNAIKKHMYDSLLHLKHDALQWAGLETILNNLRKYINKWKL